MLKKLQKIQSPGLYGYRGSRCPIFVKIFWFFLSITVFGEVGLQGFSKSNF